MEQLHRTLHHLKSRDEKPSHKDGFIELFISKRLIQGLATAMMGMFLPIFLYEISDRSFTFVAGFFMAASLGYALLLAWGMKVTNWIGFSRALALGAVFSVVQFTLLYFMDEGNLWVLIVPLTLATVGFRIFHWVPYHVDFTVFTKGGERGRDVALVFATIAFMGMLGPVLAGYIVTYSGYSVLFGTCLLLIALAGVTYLWVPAVQEKFTWSYRETVEHLFSRRFRNVLLGEMANGAEIIITLVAWPIFLYEILDGDLLEVGFLSTLIVAVTIGIQVVVGKHLDAHKDTPMRTLKRGSIFHAFGWVIKIFVFSATQVFFVGLYHNITKIFFSTPYSAILYDMSGEQGHYVDEFTVMREMASHLGRGLSLFVMIMLTTFVSVEWTFIIGAVASLLVNMVYRARQ